MLGLVQHLRSRCPLPFWRYASALLTALALPVHAQEHATDRSFRLGYAPSAYHLQHNDAHIRYNHLVAGELLSPRGTLWNAQRSLIGLAVFNNSFGQFSQYAYIGQEWDLSTLGPGTVFVNATLGLLHGYRGEHQGKIPFNDLGVAPVIIPTAGWRHGQTSVSLIMLGTNGFMLGASWTFDSR